MQEREKTSVLIISLIFVIVKAEAFIIVIVMMVVVVEISSLEGATGSQAGGMFKLDIVVLGWGGDDEGIQLTILVQPLKLGLTYFLSF